MKSLLECPESHFSFSLIEPMVFWSFSKKGHLISYCLIITGGPQRGRVGGPLGGPAAVSAFRVFHRISAFSGIFKIFRDFPEFSEIPSFSWNWGSPRRRCEDVDIPKGILMISRCPSLQSQYFLWNSWKSWNSRNFLKIMEFYEIPRFMWKCWLLQRSAPQNHQYSLRNINVSCARARGAAFSQQKQKIHEYL